jgi:uncharacterized protein YbjT (DUF2867 family)
MKVILTGATGMVGEGVLFECLRHPDIEEVLMVNRRSYEGLKHNKLKECIVRDFFDLAAVTDQLKGYDGCLYCAGISSRGLSEVEYSIITFDTTLAFARKLLDVNPGIRFSFVSGSHTDSSEHGPVMWARVKGKTENALMKLPFKEEYNFRPGFMKPTGGQKNVKSYYKVISWLYPFLSALFPSQTSSMREVGLAMINSILKGYPKQTLEIKDIKLLAQGHYVY